MNKVVLLGRLVRDVDIRRTGTNNLAVARYTLAVNRDFKQNNEAQADFISCVAFGKNAEFAGKYLSKGKRIAIEGRIQTGSYTDNTGKKIYTTDIIVEHHEFVDPIGASNMPYEPTDIDTRNSFN